MAEKRNITAEFVRTILDYDQETGVLRWRKRTAEDYGSARWAKRWNTCFAGKVAGGKNALGYGVIGICDKTYSAHRIIWLWMKGEFPSKEIDHINMNPADNRWCNLREATRSQNQCNVAVRRDSKTGLKGVNAKGSRYEVKLGRNHIGYFDCPAAASFAYQLAADAKYGKYARPL